MSHPRILERMDIVEGFPAVDLQGGANSGDYISLKNARRVAVVFLSGLGTAGDDPTLTLQQAQDVAGTGVKALNFTEILRKQAATSLAAVAQWTRTTQAAANTYTNGTSAEEDLVWVVEIDPTQLDVENGFDCIRATVADVGGNAQPGALFYLVEKQVEGDPTTALSLIAD
ncbi:MAG: hypothetical protein AB7I38_17075 [Dehalococcoidia bacterium]